MKNKSTIIFMFLTSLVWFLNFAIDYTYDKDFTTWLYLLASIGYWTFGMIYFIIEQFKKLTDNTISNAKLLSACQWDMEQFKRLADEGHYPEFMLSQNGGNGVMPLVDAIKSTTENHD